MKSKTIVKNRIVDIDYEKNKISWLYYMPLLLIAGFVPLIVYGKYVNLNGTTQALFWTGQNELLDFFSYWKSRWLIFLTAVALITYIFLFITKKLPFKKEYKYYIPLAIYAFFVILSTIFAIDVPTALNGFVDMYQGMWVLLSYVTITFLVINFVNSERDIKLFLYAFIFLIIVEGLIGIGQYFGFDIFNTKFGNSLIIPSGITVDGGLKFNFGKYTIYGTLFNTNFVGSFAALMLPMAMVFLITAKTGRCKIIGGLALILGIFTWIGCNSKAGYIGVLFSLVITIVMLRRLFVKYWKMLLGACVLAITLILGLNYMSDGRIVSQIKRFNVVKELKVIKEEKELDLFRYKSIELGKNFVNIKGSHQDLNIKIDGDKLYFIDNYGEILPMKITDEGFHVIDDPEQQYLKVAISEEYQGFIVTAENKIGTIDDINFYIDDEGVKIIGSRGRLIEPIIAETFKPLDGFENLASNRGYIWSRSIAMLQDYFFIASGPDNYPIAFPQDDFVAKLNMNWSPHTVIDKPHNMYLQIALNTGSVSLIVLLTVWLLYAFSSIKLYWKLKFDSFEKHVGLACMISLIGYLISGIFNDHIVSVAPIFWVILGLGISINIKIKKTIN